MTIMSNMLNAWKTLITTTGNARDFKTKDRILKQQQEVAVLGQIEELLSIKVSSKKEKKINSVVIKGTREEEISVVHQEDLAEVAHHYHLTIWPHQDHLTMFHHQDHVVTIWDLIVSERVAVFLRMLTHMVTVTVLLGLKELTSEMFWTSQEASKNGLILTKRHGQWPLKMDSMTLSI